MDPRFHPHNTHKEEPGSFQDRDPHLALVRKQALVHRPALLEELPVSVPGVYSVGGGRQVGKTTLLKMWMASLLDRGIPPQNITFMSGELMDDHHTLLRLLQEELASGVGNLRFVVLDEVTYVREWDRAVKYAADAGMLEQTVLVLSGSDLSLMMEARKRLPGRRGKAAKVDFHLYPLSFREAVLLKRRDRGLLRIDDARRSPTEAELDMLYEELRGYLLHGGYLTAMNDVARNRTISPATLDTYSDWIRGDMSKRGKKEETLREIVSAIVKRYGSQVTWNALAKEMSVDHPRTVADYVELLASMEAVFIQPALLEDRLAAAPKKARKVFFTDPFIFHAMRAWLHPTQDPHGDQIEPVVIDGTWESRLVEACAVTQYRRHFPTYYIKAEGEVDVAYVAGRRFWPIEVKWSEHMRPKDLKQIGKYENGRILAKTREAHMLGKLPVEPLPLALFRLGRRSGPSTGSGQRDG